MFDLPADSAERTLRMFSQQSRLEVVFSSTFTKGVRTAAVRGELTPRHALDLMLQGTGLVVFADAASGAFSVRKETPEEAKNEQRVAPANLASHPATGPSFARVAANATSTASGSDSGPAKPTVVLSPFEVNSSRDVGYLAKDTLAGSRLNTALKDVAAQISIMTPEFLQDVAAVTLDDAMRYSLNVENTSEYYDVTSSNNSTLTTQPQSGNNRVRGLGQATPTHDFFQTLIPIDTYNTERFTFVYGPNAILFGSGNPSGSTDTTFKRARTNKPAYSLETRFDSNDSWRTALDLNQPLLKNKVALRVAAVKLDQREARKPNFDRQERVYATLQVEPFKWVRARAYWEDVHRDRMPVRPTLVTDGVTPWIRAGRPLYDNGVGKPLPANNNVPGTTGFNPVFQIYNDATRPVALLGNTSGNSPYGFMYANNTVVTRGYDTAAPAPDNFDYSLTDASIFPLNTNINGSALQSRNHADIRGFTIELNPLKNFHIEIGSNQERFVLKSVDLLPFGSTELLADANLYLPDRVTPNPNVGRFYLNSGPNTGMSYQRYDSRRISGSYELNFTDQPGWRKWLGRHRLAALWSEDDSRDARVRVDFRLINNPASVAANLPRNSAGQLLSPADTLRATARDVRLRFYVDSPSDPRSRGVYHALTPFDPFAPGILPGTDWEIGTLDSPLGSTDALANSRRSLKGNVQTIQSHLLRDRLVVTYGMRRDTSRSFELVTDKQLRTGTNGSSGVNNQAGYDWWYNQFDGRKQAPDAYVLNQVRSGRTTLINLVAHPLPWMSLFYDQSNTQDPPTGIKLNLDGTPTQVGDGEGKNYGIALRFLRDNLVLRINRQETLQLQGINNTLRAAGGIGGINPFRDAVHNIERSVMLAGAPPSEKYSYYSLDMLSLGTGSRPAGNRETYDVVSDYVSKGTEIELIANPTPNWRVSASFARTEAVESNIAATYYAFIEERLPVWSRFKSAPVYNRSTSTVNDIVVGNAINSWNFIKSAEGRNVNQLSRDRFNVTTRYTFSRSPLKGFFVGGSALWRSAATLGYGSKTVDVGQLQFTEGFVGPNDTLVINDINQPIKGRAIEQYDGFLGYSRRLWNNRVNWRVQLNVRNLFDDTDLVPQRVTSSGIPVVFRMPEKRTFILSNNFTF